MLRCECCAKVQATVKVRLITNERRHLGASEAESLDLCTTCAGIDKLPPVEECYRGDIFDQETFDADW